MKQSLSSEIPQLVRAGYTSSLSPPLPLSLSPIKPLSRIWDISPNAQMSFELIWNHVDILCGLLQCPEIFNMSDRPDLSPRALTLSTDTSTNCPERTEVENNNIWPRGAVTLKVQLFWVTTLGTQISKLSPLRENDYVLFIPPYHCYTPTCPAYFKWIFNCFSGLFIKVNLWAIHSWDDRWHTVHYRQLAGSHCGVLPGAGDGSTHQINYLWMKY